MVPKRFATAIVMSLQYSNCNHDCDNAFKPGRVGRGHFTLGRLHVVYMYNVWGTLCTGETFRGEHFTLQQQ